MTRFHMFHMHVCLVAQLAQGCQVHGVLRSLVCSNVYLSLRLHNHLTAPCLCPYYVAMFGLD